MHASTMLYRLTGDGSWLDVQRRVLDQLYKVHGQATGKDTNMAKNFLLRQVVSFLSGVISGDECLAGRKPWRGTETCVVVELLQTYTTLLHATGNLTYADRVERIVLNALPGAFFNGTMGA
jgi:DUF1680 family protein